MGADVSAKLPVLQEHEKLVAKLDWAQEKVLKKLGVKVDCRRGCAWCCIHDQPYIDAHEAATLATLIKDNPKFHDVLEKIHGDMQRFLAEAEAGSLSTFTGNYPCPFLGEDKACRIYASRPIGCVVTFSTDAASCEAFAKGDEEQDGWAVPEGLKEQMKPLVFEKLGAEGQLALRVWAARHMVDQGLPLTFAIGRVLYPEIVVQIGAAAAARKA